MDTYTAWAKVPEHLKTKTQLNKAGLKRKPNQQVKAKFAGKYGTYNLYDISEAMPKSKPTQKQLDALAKGREKAILNRTCKYCNLYGDRYEYFPYSVENRVCGFCRAKFRAGHEIERVLSSDFVILDLETTGLEDTDEIVQIAITDNAGNPLLSTLVKPSKPITNELIGIHGITNEMVATAPTIAGIYEQLLTVTRGKKILCYAGHIGGDMFDKVMLQENLKRASLSPLENRWINILPLVSDWNGNWSSHYKDFKFVSLKSIAYQLQISVIAPHDALEDCQTLLKVMEVIVQSSVE